jgi:serine/threonine-protein kinase
MHHSALPPAEDLTLVPLADIARGGMGTVQLCRVHGGRLDGRFLAVKRLNPAIEQEPEFVNMFLDETWITATIASPHVVKVEAWGRDAQGMFLAVELVQGVSLSRLMKESREKQEPFAERTVANLMSQVCAGLEGAHGLRGENGAPLGLVHRDLTPGNLLVGFDGMVKIADFGIAKAEERLTSTRIGMMKGKPAYMAPEQARGGGIDLRADLFALGVMTYELLSGKRPWAGNNDLEVLIAVSSNDPIDIAEHRKVSPVFADIVRKCLKKRPSDRFSSATEIRELLDGWRRDRGFDSDDRASLEAFVVRNTSEQQKWFRDALGGQLARGGVTFMDLEAKIDKGRKHVTGPQADKPSSVSGVMRAAEQQGYAPSAAAAPDRGPELEEIDENARTRFLAERSPAAKVPIAPPTPRLEAPPGFTPRLASTVALSPEEANARLNGPRSNPGSLGLPPPRAGGASTIAAEPLGPASGLYAASPVTGPASAAAWGPAPQQQGWGGPMSAAPMSPAPMSPSPMSPAPSSGGPLTPSPYSPMPGSGAGGYPLPPPGSGQAFSTPSGRIVDTVNSPGNAPSRMWLWALVVIVACAGAGAAVVWFLTRHASG